MLYCPTLIRHSFWHQYSNLFKKSVVLIAHFSRVLGKEQVQLLWWSIPAYHKWQSLAASFCFSFDLYFINTSALKMFTGLFSRIAVMISLVPYQRLSDHLAGQMIGSSSAWLSEFYQTSWPIHILVLFRTRPFWLK